jgi:hypothetical protein
MARYHATVESRSPAAETFAYLATFSHAAEWDPGVLAGEQLDAGPPTDRIVVTGAEHGSTVSYDAEMRLRGPLQLLDPLLRPAFRVVAERAAAGLARGLSRRPAGRGNRTPAAAPALSGGAAQPAEGKP